MSSVFVFFLQLFQLFAEQLFPPLLGGFQIFKQHHAVVIGKRFVFYPSRGTNSTLMVPPQTMSSPSACLLFR